MNSNDPQASIGSPSLPEEVYIRRVLAKGTTIHEGGKRFKRVSRMIMIEGISGLVTLGCLVQLERTPGTPIYYFLLNQHQLGQLKDKFPGYRVHEKENGEACVLIKWEQYWFLINGNKM